MDREQIEKLLHRGIWMGVNQPSCWALTSTQVFEILGELEAVNVPILGGDVYEYQGSDLRPAYMNWHSDRRLGESNDDFALRSIEETKSYVSKIAKIDNAYMFVLVPALNKWDEM